MDGGLRKCASTLGYFLAGLGIGSMFSVLLFPPSVENGTQDSLAKVAPKGGYMQEEIGTTAGAIWKILHAKGELSLTQLKKQTKAKPPVFDWAIGWLARENKIVFKQQKRSIRVRLV
jgi:Winged helix-turn-helix domain (DUF2582)